LSLQRINHPAPPAVLKTSQQPRAPAAKVKGKGQEQKMCFYREGDEIGTGLCNRGTKGVLKDEKRLQCVKWTDNLQEWIPETGDVYINQSSVKAYARNCTAKYKRADGSSYTALPVLPADEWDRIYLALHSNATNE
jgi:hypothetical protein